MPDVPDEPSVESSRPVLDAGSSRSSASFDHPVTRQPAMADAFPLVVFLGLILSGYAAWDLLRLMSWSTISLDVLIRDSTGRRYLASVFVGLTGCGFIALGFANYCRQLWLSRKPTTKGSTAVANAHYWLWMGIAIYALLKIGLRVLWYSMLLSVFFEGD